MSIADLGREGRQILFHGSSRNASARQFSEKRALSDVAVSVTNRQTTTLAVWDKSTVVRDRRNTRIGRREPADQS